MNTAADILLSVRNELGVPDRRHPVNQEAVEAWRQARFGLFIHWGIYSIPGGIWQGKRIEKLGEQIQRHARIPQQEYAALAEQFNPVQFDAGAIAGMARDAGMRYIVITAKHHDGFCMFKSDYTDYNIVDATPFGRDVVGELAAACAAEGLRFGLYYSNPDWGYSGAVKREPANAYAVFEPFTSEHLEYSCNQLRELLTNYGPISEIFFDMGLPTLEESVRLARTVHECQPRCLVSGRVMNNQGDFLTLPDNHMPDHPIETAWETPCTFYHTWGYKSWI
ncbi:MAG: alpha-L-fucosidase, partial [Lentisphaerae bacterium]|nr:alpha-L-fucosidase [Lentisphaerota bacterium]